MRKGIRAKIKALFNYLTPFIPLLAARLSNIQHHPKLIKEKAR